jgi:hypothetical protein
MRKTRISGSLEPVNAFDAPEEMPRLGALATF